MVRLENNSVLTTKFAIVLILLSRTYCTAVSTTYRLVEAKAETMKNGETG
jgi:hypothetical protein